MQPYEGVEDEEHGPQRRDGFGESPLIGRQVEADSGGRDDVEVEVGEADVRRATDALEPVAHDVQGVLGGEEEHPTWASGGEAPETRDARCDRHGQVEREEGLAALGLAPHDANGLVGPQAVDEPMPFRRTGGEAPGELDGQRGHRPRPRAWGRGFGGSGGGAAKTSKKSFSSSWRASRCAPARRRSLARVISAR